MAIIIIMAKKKRSLSQGFEEHELRENDSDNAHEERDGANQQKKGAKKPPKVRKLENWTRVIHVGVTERNEISIRDVQVEVDFAKENPLPPRQIWEEPWSLYFNPVAFEKANKGG